MKVELRNHPSQLQKKTLTLTGVNYDPVFDANGDPVPLFPDQYGVYLQLTPAHQFRCVGYCLKAVGKPISLIENWPTPSISKFVLSETERLREAVQRDGDESLAKESIDESGIAEPSLTGDG